MINKKAKESTLPELQKIEEQVLDIMQMIESETYCIDVLNQITATQKDIDRVIKIVMKRHFETCVSNAVKKGAGQGKIEELIAAVFKHSKR